jgi:hypothetical protein
MFWFLAFTGAGWGAESTTFLAEIEELSFMKECAT